MSDKMNVLKKVIYPDIIELITEINKNNADINELIFYINDHYRTILTHIENTETCIEFVISHIHNKRLVYPYIYEYYAKYSHNVWETFPKKIEPYIISDWRYFVDNAPNKNLAMGIVFMFDEDKGIYKDAVKSYFNL